MRANPDVSRRAFGRRIEVVAVNLFDSLFGVSSRPSQRRGGHIMNAATAKRAPRKIIKKATVTAEEKAYLASLSPKHRKLIKLLKPLQGKLDKVLTVK
jgi:hypothetical protein